MCRQRALRPNDMRPFILLRRIGVICAAKGHCDPLGLLNPEAVGIGVICAAKGHCDTLTRL